MQFQVLGPLTVLDDGKVVALGGPKPRALLAVLLVHANRFVSVDRLIEELWGEDVPATAAATVQTYVSRLRRVLPADTLVAQPGGYVLSVAVDSLDSAQFEGIVAQARQAVSAERPSLAARLLTQALAMWRGAAFADLDGATACAEAARLEEARLSALEDRVEANLGLGGHAALIGELDAAVNAHPYRERLAGQLMLALYRCGRQAEALRVFQHTRTVLVDELGVEPGVALRQLEAAMLTQDDALGGGSLGPALPGGVVTFLLTDIEGSTAGWEAHPETMPDALAAHDAAIAVAVSECGGRLMLAQGEGDSTLSVFPLASDAAAAALAIQRALTARMGDGPAMVVRIGIHTGEATVRDGTYCGPVVNRAARVRALAAGGQTLVTQSTAEIVADHLPPGASLVDLGAHRLRGMARSEHVHGLAHPDVLTDYQASNLTRDRAQERAIVGREVELRVLRGALDDVIAGHGRLALVAGEAGIGKTRLAEALVADAELTGFKVIWGRSHEGEGAPAYWPWVQLIRTVLADTDTAMLRADLGASASVLAQLVPEIVERVAGAAPLPGDDSDSARFRLFDAATAFILAAARRRPLLIVLDDLHWADPASLLLLRFFGRHVAEGRLLLLGTYRPADLERDHPLVDTIAALERVPDAQRITLAGLSSADVGRLVKLTVDRDTSEELVSRVHAFTEGNPFFVSSVVRLLDMEGRLDAAGAGDLAVPDGARSVIGRRRLRLSDRADEVLAAASVLGREFDTVALASITGMGMEEILEALDEAVDAHLAEPVAHDVGRYRFAHALVRETLYQDLGRAQRARLHRRAGEALEAGGAPDAEAHVAELAHHFFMAAAIGDATKAVEYALRAGGSAEGRLAYEEAAAHCQHAIEAMRLSPSPDEELRGELHLRAGKNHWRAGDHQAAREAVERAAAIARRLDRPVLLARAALTGAPFGFGGGVDDDGPGALLQEALDALSPTDSDLRSRVMARRADSTDLAVAARIELAREATAMARRLGNPHTLAAVLLLERGATAGPGNPRERLAISDEAVRLAEPLRDAMHEFEPRSMRIQDLLDLGETTEADRELDATRSIADKLRIPHGLWVVTTLEANRAFRTGRIDDAERLALEAYTVGGRSRNVFGLQLVSLQMNFIRREQARLAELEQVTRTGIERTPDNPVFRCSLAQCLAETGQRAEAITIVRDLIRNDAAALPRDSMWLGNMWYLAEASAAAGDAESAAVLHDLLAPYEAGFVTYSIGIFAGAVSRLLGVLAITLGRFDVAIEGLEAAVEAERRTGAVIWLGHSLEASARAHAHRAGPGDRSAAERCASEALAIARTNSLALLERRCLVLGTQ